jgi:Ca-activated chloride channel family protein
VVALLVTAVVVILAGAAEALHIARVRRVAHLAFGPKGRPRIWAMFSPVVRVICLGGLTWSLITLFLLEPKVHKSAEEIPEKEMRHLIILLDVSPSVRLVDAGVDHKLSRRKRAKELVESFFGRVAVRQYLVTVIAVYNGAIPVVEKTRDQDVVRHILDDLPLEYAFRSGGTDIFKGLEEAARIAHPWQPKSATLLMVTDGDTVPNTGMPKMPASIANVLILGVGNPREGKFINGRHSRQEASTLRQIAARLGGVYHDGNEKHISSDIIREITQAGAAASLDRLSLREYALMIAGVCATLLALLPLALQHYGTRWTPGVQQERIVALNGSNGKTTSRLDYDRKRSRESVQV